MIACLLATRTVSGQVFDENGQRIDSGVPLRLRGGAPIPVWIAVGNREPSRSVPGTGKPDGMGFRMPFMQRAFVCRVANASNGEPYLLLASRQDEGAKTVA